MPRHDLIGARGLVTIFFGVTDCCSTETAFNTTREYCKVPVIERETIKKHINPSLPTAAGRVGQDS